MSVLDIVSLIVIIIFFISGIVAGLFGKLNKIIALVCGVVGSYFIATPLNNYFIDHGFYDSMVSSSGWEPGVINSLMLVAIYLGAFLIVYIIGRLIFGALHKAVNSIKIFKVIDKILGIAAGLFTGFFILCLVFQVMATISTQNLGFQEWLTADLDQSFGLSSWLFEFATKVA